MWTTHTPLTVFPMMFRTAKISVLERCQDTNQRAGNQRADQSVFHRRDAAPIVSQRRPRRSAKAPAHATI